MFKRGIWLTGVIVLTAGFVLELPILRQQAGATEVTIDSDVHNTDNAHETPGQRTVFTSDQTGYVFFVDSDGTCAYSKTTNGGTSWGGAVAIDSQTDCLMPSIWYDRWTPGDTTGNYIHIAYKDGGSDDLWYERIDTASSDGQLGEIAVSGASGANKTNTFGTGVNNNNFPAITKGTDGDLYIGVEDTDASDESYVLKCTGTCGTASNWSTTETNWTSADVGTSNALILLPLASANIMAIHFQPAADDYEYQTYTDSGGTWDHDADAWTDIDGTGTEVERPSWGAAVDPLTNDIYLTFVDINVAGTADDDVIKSYLYNGSWTAKTNILTDSGGDNTRPIWVQPTFNINNKDVYAMYIRESTSGTVTTRDVYYKKSTDGMTTWGFESSTLNTAQDDIDVLFVGMSSTQRVYVAWRAKDTTNPDQLRGETVADLVPPTYAQQVYRFLANADDTTAGSALASENSSATLTSVGDAFRLRILLRVGGDGARASLDSLKLQYAVKSGTCDTAYSGETYADVTTSTPISYKNNATPSDGANLTANASNDPTDSGITINNQTYEEANNFTNSTSYIGTGEDGMWDFALYENLASPSTNFCLRVVYSDGSTIATPVVVPEVITASCTTGTTTDQLMRHGKIFAGGVEEKLCSAN